MKAKHFDFKQNKYVSKHFEYWIWKKSVIIDGMQYNNTPHIQWHSCMAYISIFFSYLLKCFRNAALTKYNAIGLAQLFPNDKQNPMIRKTCQKALYSLCEFLLQTMSRTYTKGPHIGYLHTKQHQTQTS